VPIVERADLKVFLRNELPSVDDPIIDMARDTAELLVKSTTGRTWTVAGAPTVKSFRPRQRSRRLMIPDAATITSVVENGTTLVAGTDYVSEPLNGETVSGEARPTEWLTRIDCDWYTYDLRTTVTVTAGWGWTAIPTDLVEAIYLLTKDVVQHRESQFGGVAGFTDVAAVRIRNAPLLDLIEHKYQRVKFA
jgi:hypothetical protein